MMTAPHGQRISTRMVAFAILRHEGPFGFFKGALPRFFWVAPLGAMNFAGYELAKKAMIKSEEASSDEIPPKRWSCSKTDGGLPFFFAAELVLFSTDMGAFLTVEIACSCCWEIFWGSFFFIPNWQHMFQVSSRRISCSPDLFMVVTFGFSPCQQNRLFLSFFMLSCSPRVLV